MSRSRFFPTSVEREPLCASGSRECVLPRRSATPLAAVEAALIVTAIMIAAIAFAW